MFRIMIWAAVLCFAVVIAGCRSGDDDDDTGGITDDDDAVDDDDTAAADDDDDTGTDDDDDLADDDDATIPEEDFWAALVLFLCEHVMDCWPDVVDHYGWESAEECLPTIAGVLSDQGCTYTGIHAQECLEGIEIMTCEEFEVWLKQTAGPCMDALDCT